MDQITGISDLVMPNVLPLCVETNQPAVENMDGADLCVETGSSSSKSEKPSPKTGLCVETITLKECSVRLVRLEVLFFPKRVQHTPQAPQLPQQL